MAIFIGMSDNPVWLMPTLVWLGPDQVPYLKALSRKWPSLSIYVFFNRVLFPASLILSGLGRLSDDVASGK